MFPDAAPRIPAHIVIDERRVGRYTLRNVLDSQRLHELFAILREIHTIHQPDELWRSVLALVRDVTGRRRIFFSSSG